MSNLRELIKHPGWQEYLDETGRDMVGLFMELFQLDATKPESFVKFVELKSKIDQLRDITYFYERQLTDDIGAVDAKYENWFVGILKKLIGANHG